MLSFQHERDIPVILRRRKTPKTRLDNFRNLKTIQYALLRGDVEVTLNNADTLNAADLGHLRLTHNTNFPLFANFEPPFRLFRNKAPNRVTDDVAKGMFDGVDFKGVQFEFIKILGGGGYGVATLWNVHLEGGIFNTVVIKFGLSDHFDPMDEEYWHKRYHGSIHTVQIVDIDFLAEFVRDQFTTQRPGEALQYDRGVQFKTVDSDSIVLEYMCHGDLSRFLFKASAQRKLFPNRVLWGMWECSTFILIPLYKMLQITNSYIQSS